MTNEQLMQFAQVGVEEVIDTQVDINEIEEHYIDEIEEQEMLINNEMTIGDLIDLVQDVEDSENPNDLIEELYE